MRISVKGRYALSSMIYLAEYYQKKECVTVISLAKELEISKIYLEQVFALLKRANLVVSTKGAQGGYILGRMPREITGYDILEAIETGLFEQTARTLGDKRRGIEEAMEELVFSKLDAGVKSILQETTLEELAALVASKEQASTEEYMYYL